MQMKSNYIKKICTFIFAFAYVMLYCQNFNIYKYGSDYKLLSNNVVDIVSDNNLCFIATDQKIFNYDGVNFVEVKIKNPNFKYKNVKKLSLSKNYLTILYDKGCADINLTDYSCKLISNEEILDVCQEQNFVYLLKKNLSIEKIERVSNSVAIITHFRKFYDNNRAYRRCNIAYYNDRIFISVPQEGIFSYRNGRVKKYQNQFIDPGGFSEFFKIQNKKLFFMGLRDIVVYNKDKDSFAEYKMKSSNYFRILDFVTIDKKDIFIQNDKDLFIRDGSTVKKIDLLEKDFNTQLKKIIKFKNSILVSSGKGLIALCKKYNYITSITNEYYNNKQFRTRRKIIQNGENIILFGNPDAVILNNHKISSPHHPIPLAIYDAVLTKNEFFISTEGEGLFWSDLSLSRYLKVPLNDYGNKSQLCALFYDKKTNEIYCSNDQFFYRFCIDKPHKVSFLPVPYKGNLAKVIAKDSLEKCFYIGTTAGLYKYISNKFISKPIFINGSEVGDIYIDYENDNIWIGHDKGIDIMKLSTNELVKHLPLKNFSNPKVTQILKDNNNLIWASTFKGLSCFDRKGNLISWLTQKNGLINSEFNYKAASNLSNGRLIFGGIDGYDIIDTNKFFNYLKKNNTGTVSNIALIGQDTVMIKNFENKGRIEFSYNNENYFGRIYLSSDDNPEKIRIKYRVNNGIWYDAAGSYIDLIKYETGKYTIEVLGINDLGQDVKFDNISVDIYQYFYKSPYFTLLIILFLLLLLLIIGFLKVRNKEKINKVYNQISMDLHDELGTVLSKTSFIVSMDKYIDDSLKEILVSNLEQASNSLKIFINFYKFHKVSSEVLYFEIFDIFSEYLYCKNIIFNAEKQILKERNIDTQLSKNVKLCCYELANNIMKYSTADFVRMIYIVDKDTTLIEIQTNEPFSTFDSQKKVGNGLKNISERTKSTGGFFNIVSSEGSVTFILKFHI